MTPNRGAEFSKLVLVATESPQNPNRERSEVADLIRHIREHRRNSGEDPGGAEEVYARRTGSFCDAEYRRATVPEATEYRRSLCSPGGFRRDHLHVRATQEGVSAEQRPKAWSTKMVEVFIRDVQLLDTMYGVSEMDEDGALLQAPSQRMVRGLGTMGCIATIFKANLGSNVLYMPHAFEQGGYFIGFTVLAALASLAVAGVALLIRCRTANVLVSGESASYGQIMEEAVGKHGRVGVQASMVLLQLGCVCSYLINCANVFHTIAFPNVPMSTLIFCEAAVIAPLVLIRNIAKLGPVNAIAGTAMLCAVFSAMSQLVDTLVREGTEPMKAVNPSGIPICMGIVSFANEGIALALPVFDAYKYPKKFVTVYACTIFLTNSLLLLTAGLGYAAFGQLTETLIVLNFPPGVFVDSLQLLFGVVMIMSIPVQILPALRIIEPIFLGPSRPFTWDKHVKSAFRVLLLSIVALISVLGATSLDHFVSLVGAVCGIPMAYIFPAVAHASLVAAPRSWAAIFDGFMILLGAVLTVAIGLQTALTWGN